MVFGSKKIESHIQLEGQDMENVEEFMYLRSPVTWNNDCRKDIKHRIGKVIGAFKGFRKI